MQKKKDEIRQKILKAAEKEFLTKGFSSTTTRELAKNARITYGNMYKYYPSKEAILEAVIKTYAEDALKGFTEFMNHSDDSGHGKNLTEGIINGLVSLHGRSRQKFIILFTGLDGSKLQNVKNEIMELLKDHISGFVQDPVFAGIITENMMSAIVTLAREYKFVDEFRNVVGLYIQYHLAGIESIR